jgi:hypothetical protein
LSAAVRASAKLREIFRDEETHIITLTEHFFHRFFNNEFISHNSESRWSVIYVLALLPLPGIFYIFFLYWPYDYIYWHFSQAVYDRATMVDQCCFVIFAMVVIGFVVVLEWDALFPDGRDYAVLMPLPVRTGTMFTAKIVALGAFLALFAADLAVPSALLYPTAAVEGSPRLHGSILYAARLTAAHIASVGAGCVFTFLFFVAVQGLLMSLFGYRMFKRISVFVQVVSAIVLLLMFSLIPLVSSLLPAWKRANSPALFLLPPMWFLGLYRTLLGAGDQAFRQLAQISLCALGLVILISAVTYLVRYRIYVQRGWELAAAGEHGRSAVRRLLATLANRLVLRKPLERATFYFVLATVFRSARHRLYLATYLGVGFALALLGTGELFVHSQHGSFLASLRYPNEALLSIPLVLSFFMLSGMRMIFTIPAEVSANWIFQISEDGHRKECLSGVRKSMVLLAIVPLFVVLFPVFTALWSLALALFETVFGVALAFILMELLLLNFRKVPFTCSFLPEKANFILLGVFYWLAFTTYAYTMARLEYWMLDNPARWITGLAVMLCILAGLIGYRSRVLDLGFSFIYEEEPEPAVRVLGLSS